MTTALQSRLFREPVSLSGIAETLLIPLWARAVETTRPDAIIRDPIALHIFESLDYDFSKFDGAWVTQPFHPKSRKHVGQGFPALTGGN